MGSLKNQFNQFNQIKIISTLLYHYFLKFFPFVFVARQEKNKDYCDFCVYLQAVNTFQLSQKRDGKSEMFDL